MHAFCIGLRQNGSLVALVTDAKHPVGMGGLDISWGDARGFLLPSSSTAACFAFGSCYRTSIHVVTSPFSDRCWGVPEVHFRFTQHLWEELLHMKLLWPKRWTAKKLESDTESGVLPTCFWWYSPPTQAWYCSGMRRASSISPKIHRTKIKCWVSSQAHHPQMLECTAWERLDVWLWGMPGLRQSIQMDDTKAFAVICFVPKAFLNLQCEPEDL